jgi:DNA-binding SARP family transcriptional activator/tetratricopeptide (TPR) repeat protein
MLRGNRFRLVTLGRLTLLDAAGDEDASLAKRRRKLALLAVLAMARRPISRATLLEMFWGEQDEARARHSLSNALSSLRRALGQQSITTRDADVALATDAPLDIDALDVADAAEGGDFARVVELYGGPFLEGTHVDDSTSFDQWVTRERRRVEVLFLKGCSQQCAVLARGERWTECHALAARWIDTEPLAADAAMFLLNASKARGTRVALAQALDEYERLRARLEVDFDLPPEPAVRQLAVRIRDELATVGPDSPAEVGAEVVTATPMSAAPAPSPDAPPLEPPPSLSLSHRPRGLTRVIAALAAATIIGVVAFRIVASRADRGVGLNDVASGRRPVIAVLAVEERGADSTIDWLVDGLPQMITGKLAHIAAVDVVPPARIRALLERSGHLESSSIAHETARDLGRRVGATIVAHGTIGRDGANLVLDLTIHDVSSGNLVRNDVLTQHDALSLADAAAARILSAANVNAPGAQLAELETSSLDAYQHFVRGLNAGQAGLLRESRSETDAAIAIDSGFITAIRQRIGMAIADNDTLLTRRLRETMRKHFDRATEFDRLDQEAGDAFASGERERSEALARALVRRYPRDPRAYQLLASVLGGHGEFAEAERVATQVLALDSLAMEAGTGPCPQCVGFFNIVTLHLVRADFRVAADWGRRWIRAQPDAPAAWASLAWTYSYMQRPDSALPLIQRAVSLSGGDPWAVDQLARILLVARRYEAADSAIAGMEVNPSPERREAVADLRTLLDREHGQYRAANRVLDRLEPSPKSSGLDVMIRGSNLRALGDYAGAARLYERSGHGPTEGPLQFPLPGSSARGFCWHHALAADAIAPAGDTLVLRAAADTLEAACVRSFYGRDWRLYHHVRGLLAMRLGRYAEAEREFTQAVWTPIEGWARTTVELARAQAAQGRPRDAIATLRSAYATRLDAMARYVPISELDYWMAGTFAQMGQADSARVYAGYVQSAWRGADPEVRLRLAGLP